MLIDAGGLDLTNGEQVYEKIKELAPTLAGVSISMIPGEYPYNFQPSPQANIILSSILESPKKDVSPSYATHFLEYRGIVSTEYLTNYIDSSASTALVKDPVLGINFLHFSMSPKKMSIDYYQPKDEYYCNFKMSVSLRSGETIIYQYSKDYPFYFPPANAENIRSNGIAVQDSFPVIEGKYELTVLLQNLVGKEFSIYEKEVALPEESDSPRIIGPVLGYKLQDYNAILHAPFKVMDKQLLVDPDNTFASRDDLALFLNIANLKEDIWKEGELEVLIKGSKANNPFQKNFSLKLANFIYNRVLGVSFTTPAHELIPDYYEGNERYKFDYFFLKGQALAGKGAYAEAVESLLEGNKIYNSDTRLLNSLGFCYYKTSKKREALEALGASLRLNPEQKEIKELFAEIEKRLKD